jgi:serine/threonine protein kinase
MFRREIFTLTTLNHPSILKLLGYTNQPPFCLVTEFMSNGSLFDVLKSKQGGLTPTDRTVIALDIARGMEYMHERNMIHRDLKSLNILLDDNRRARICDFGLVRLKSLAPLTGLIGTPQWMAPEILMCSTYYDVKVDVFSFGIVLWELLTGEIPYRDIPVEKLGYLVVQEELRPEIPKVTPPSLAHLIDACWSPDPKQRPTFTMIINFFNNIRNICHIFTSLSSSPNYFGLQKFTHKT